jgi:phosphoribosylaminoimidazole-succinocarboxamide synthase
MLYTDYMPYLKSGKVRDIYEYDEKHYLFRTSNRISAFDVVLQDEIPNKGSVLNELTVFWMRMFKDVVPNHLSDMEPPQPLPSEQKGQLMVVKKLTPLPIEAIVRGYIIGSGWKDYQETGKICGIELPKGLKQASHLPNPIYTPSTKAFGGHDVNISFEETEFLVRNKYGKCIPWASDDLKQCLPRLIKEVSINLYLKALIHALERGIIIADTKFEFGLDDDCKLHLIDEVLTPDSSRFWSKDEYQAGMSPPSYDKQIIRDYLETSGWDKKSTPPKLPAEIIEKTAARYEEIKERLMGPPIRI